MGSNKNESGLLSLKDKIVVVAGGSNKVGKAIAEKLAQTGATIVIADVNLINAEVVVQTIIDKYKSEAVAVGLNIIEIKALLATLKDAEGKKKSIDVWINTSSICLLEKMGEVSKEEADRLMNKNIHAVFALSKEVADYMRDSGVQGIIINIIPVRDLAKLAGLPQQINADKYISDITSLLSKSFQKSGIRFFTISPVSLQGIATDAVEDSSCAATTLSSELALLVLFCIAVLAQSSTGRLITINKKQIFIDSK